MHAYMIKVFIFLIITRFLFIHEVYIALQLRIVLTVAI
jgi:hypothetical protein